MLPHGIHSLGSQLVWRRCANITATQEYLGPRLGIPGYRSTTLPFAAEIRKPQKTFFGARSRTRDKSSS
jgi:hypothetical protein